MLVAEDINFFSHRGFELAELQNALEDALRDRELPRGASTITQQLAKNLWLSPSRNPWRKAKEAILTWQMERALSEAPHPRAVPERRRARARRLRRRRGEPALLRQARHPSWAPAEAAQLAAALPNPAVWHPGVDSPGYRRRVASIRERMARAAFLGRQL